MLPARRHVRRVPATAQRMFPAWGASALSAPRVPAVGLSRAPWYRPPGNWPERDAAVIEALQVLVSTRGAASGTAV